LETQRKDDENGWKSSVAYASIWLNAKVAEAIAETRESGFRSIFGHAEVQTLAGYGMVVGSLYFGLWHKDALNLCHGTRCTRTATRGDFRAGE
jgi:hypothetical protein